MDGCWSYDGPSDVRSQCCRLHDVIVFRATHEGHQRNSKCERVSISERSLSIITVLRCLLWSLIAAVTMSSRFASSMTLKRALTRALSARYTLLSCEGSFTWASGGGTRRALHKCKSGSGSRTIRTPLAPKKTRAAHAATGAIPLAGESCAETTLKPTSLQLRTLFISSAVPVRK